MFIYDPVSLPTIDKMRVFVLGQSHVEENLTTPFFDSGWKFAIQSQTEIEDREALRYVVESWRQLPSNDPSRCHTPPYGLSFFQQGEWVLSASLCWHCNNIFLQLPQGRSGYDFDGESASAQRLLRLLRYLSGNYLQQSGGKILTLQDFL